jgi:Arc/MetJ-type ribon-helix-helix transcriptional regulator
MSKGNPIVKTRVPEAVLRRIHETIRKKLLRNDVPADYSISDFVRDAMLELLDKPERAKRSRMKKKKLVCNKRHHELDEIIAGPHHKPDCQHYRPEGGKS